MATGRSITWPRSAPQALENALRSNSSVFSLPCFCAALASSPFLFSASFFVQSAPISIRLLSLSLSLSIFPLSKRHSTGGHSPPAVKQPPDILHRKTRDCLWSRHLRPRGFLSPDLPADLPSFPRMPLIFPDLPSFPSVRRDFAPLSSLMTIFF